MHALYYGDDCRRGRGVRQTGFRVSVVGLGPKRKPPFCAFRGRMWKRVGSGGHVDLFVPDVKTSMLAILTCVAIRKSSGLNWFGRTKNSPPTITRPLFVSMLDHPAQRGCGPNWVVARAAARALLTTGHGVAQW